MKRRSKVEEEEQEEPEDKMSVSRKIPGVLLAPEVLKERLVSETSFFVLFNQASGT